ncbi:MAG: hypothetical protein ACREMJ_07965 [Gemmatimonadales bacterium]
MTGRRFLAALALLAACGPADPCDTAYFRRVARTSQPYAGDWVVARGDTLTLPDGMGDRFKLAGFRLDTAKVAVGQACRFRGTMTFAVPAETLAVTWFGEPEHLYVFGWPAELGPFAGIGAAWRGGDSLHGAILFDEQLGVRMAPGVTAEFVAARR